MKYSTFIVSMVCLQYTHISPCFALLGARKYIKVLQNALLFCFGLTTHSSFAE